jgi:hypothetical protein
LPITVREGSKKKNVNAKNKKHHSS